MLEYCYFCKKKLNYIKFICKCGNTYCIKCRYPENHNCIIDYISLGKEELQKNNPKIQINKIKKI
jgi:hypothetical protein